MPDSTLVIPVFNHARLTAQCLNTVLGRDRCRVVVVDDGSTDTTPGLLASFGDRIKVVRHSENRGFAESCNDGAALATGKYIILLNNDTIPQPGWCEALEDYAERHPQAAVVGSKLVYPDATVQHAGVAIGQDRYPRHIYTGFAANHPAVNVSRRFQIVTGACMLVRREIFRENGGFDPAFRNGFEDVDFCLRLGGRGHEVHYCAESVVVHLESVSPGRFKHDRGNVALYRERWGGRVQPDDVRYYVEDGLLQFDYEGRYPFGMRLSPLLATLDDPTRSAELERALLERNRQVADLSRENTRLRMELGERSQDSPALRYQKLREQIRAVAKRLIPPGATVLVVSRGDGALLDLGYVGWHFPRTSRGAYAGYHPASSAEAIAHLEELRRQGADFLLIPQTSAWWLEHYSDFRRHLEANCALRRVADDCCLIYELNRDAKPETIHVRPQVAI